MVPPIAGGSCILPESIRAAVAAHGSKFGILENEATNQEELIPNNEHCENSGEIQGNERVTVVAINEDTLAPATVTREENWSKSRAPRGE